MRTGNSDAHMDRLRACAAPGPDEQAPEEIPRQHILIHYADAPAAIGRYLDRAFRLHHDVLSVGDPAPAFQGMGRGFMQDYSYADFKARLPEGFIPDLYIWVESPGLGIGTDMACLKTPSVCYLTGGSLSSEERAAVARQFLLVFVAQRSWIAPLAEQGITAVAWLPPACRDEMLAASAPDRRVDVSGLSLEGEEEIALRFLEQTTLSFRTGTRSVEEAAQAYAQSKIVLNANAGGELNSHLFDAMGAGALVISEDAEGLADLFLSGRHYMLLNPGEDFAGAVERCLADPAAMKHIAAAGRSLVHARHTYGHRADRLLVQTLETLGCLGGGSGESRFHFGGYYCAPRSDVQPYLPETIRHNLDIGCAGGELGRILKSRGAEEVVGVEILERAYEMAREVLDRVFLGNIEELELPYPEGHFDCITCTDVLEHLVDPWAALRKLHRLLSDDGSLVVSIPNVGFYGILMELVEGRWPYSDSGILDRTHLRFFTALELRKMLDGAGFEVVKLEPLTSQATEESRQDDDGFVNLPLLRIGPLTRDQHERLRTYQYVAVARKLPSDLLAAARTSLRNKEYERAFHLARCAGERAPLEGKRLMALAAARLGELDLAESIYRDLLDSREADLDDALGLALSLVLLNRIKEAKPFVEQALQADPEHPGALGTMGLIALMLGRPESAMDLLQRGLGGAPDNEIFLIDLLQAASILGRLEEVEHQARSFVERHPAFGDMRVAYAKALHVAGRTREAQAGLEAYLQLHADDAAAGALLRELEEAAR